MDEKVLKFNFKMNPPIGINTITFLYSPNTVYELLET